MGRRRTLTRSLRTSTTRRRTAATARGAYYASFGLTTFDSCVLAAGLESLLAEPYVVLTVPAEQLRELYSLETSERPRVVPNSMVLCLMSKIGAGASASRGQASVASIDPFVT